ncbi:MAG: molybdate ABC transporter substrate-binding protein [Gaiellaceae bacterium]
MSLSRSRLTVLTVVALLALLAVPAGGAAPAAQPQITVYAAASLTDVFPAIAPHEKYSFGGSNTLATQIQQGAPADVFASANMKLPLMLNSAGLCSKPVVFTRNTLVVVVPKSNPGHIHNVYDLTKPGVKIDIAQSAVPVGSYTLQILKNMNLSTAVLKNVVSQETDVREVLSKVALGEVDAGFVYSTDAKTVPGKVKVIKVPAWAQPKVQYGICVVSTSGEKPAAKAFIKLVLSKAGQKKLHKFGFLARVKAQTHKKKKK